MRVWTIAAATAVVLASCDGEGPPDRPRGPPPGGFGKAPLPETGGLLDDLRTPSGARWRRADIWEPMQGCPAAERTEPTLDPRVLPTAKARPVRLQVGQERDEAGRTVALYLDAIEETAVLAGGIGLTVKLGACDEYSNGYYFKLPIEEAKNTGSRYWLRRASQLMALVEPANINPVVDIAALRQTLDRRAADPEVDMRRGGFYGDVKPAVPPATEVDSFGVRAVTAGDHVELEVTYTIGPL